MKRILVLSGLMMAAIVALTGCQTEFGTEMVRGKALTVSASTDAGTKTVNDGMSTLWAEGDKISVFYADAGGTNYSEGIELTLSEGAGTKGGVFVDAAEASVAPDGSHDWYAIYPSGPKSPASNSAEGGFTYLGDTRGLTQEGYNSTNVLCGTACPMYGVVKSESGNPGFVMKQLATVIEFNVVNKTGNPVKVTRVTLDETETETPIIGSFYVDFTGEKPEFTPSEDASKVKTKAQVTVNGATELAEEETAKIYLPVVPYAHDPMKPFRVAIDGEIGGKAAYQEVAIDVPANKCLFEAGKIRRVHVVLDEMTLLEGNTISDVMSGNVGDNYVVSDALVTMVYDKGFFAQDGTGTILVYMNAALSVAKGDKVDINGVTSSYSNMVQFKQPAVSRKSSGNTVSLTPVPYTGTEVDAAAQNATQAYVSLTATLTSATAATVEGAEATLSLTAATDPAVTLTSGKKYNLTGYVYGCYNGKVYLYVDSAEEAGGTEPQPSSATIADAHAATSGTSIAMDDLLVAEVFPQGFMVTDNKDILFVFLKEAPTVSKGDKVSVEGTVGVYKGNKQIKEDPKPTITSSGTGTVTLSPVEWTGEDVASAYVDNNAKYVKLTASATSTVNATVEGAGEKVLYIANNQKAEGVTIEKDKTYNLTGYVYGHGTYSGTEQVYFYAESAEEVTGDDPGPGPEPGGDEITVSVTMNQYTTDNECTISSGNDNITIYKNLDLSSAVRVSTTGDPNCGAFYNSSGTIEWRLYQNKGGNVIVTVAEGCELKSVKIAYKSSNNGTLLDEGTAIASGFEVTCSGTSKTFTVGNTGDATNGQVKVTAVDVVYTGEGTLPPVEPEPEPDPEPYLTLNGKTSLTLNFDAVPGDRQIVEVSCDNDNWTVTGVPDWAIVDTDTYPGKIVVGVQENTGDERSADVSVNHSNGEIVRTLTIKQAAVPVATGHSYVKTSTLSEGKFILVSEFNSTSYVCSGLITNKSLTLVDASTLISNDAIASDTNIDKYAIDLSEVTGGYTFTNSDGKYINVSKGDLSASTTEQVWTISQHTDGSWIFAHSTTDTRSLFIGNSGAYCKNYANSNFGASGYASTYFTLYKYQ